MHGSLSIGSPASSGVVLTQVRLAVPCRFLARRQIPLSASGGDAANGNITVNGFTDAFTTSTDLVPQNGTARMLDTLGDKIVTPVVLQNLASFAESLWASHTVNNNQGSTGPTAIRWYQFNVTGGVIPAAAAQQQSFNNAADGLFRWMPSIAVDSAGNMAIAYSTSKRDD